MTQNQSAVQSMAFYHDAGLPAAWKQAARFAGNGGRLATMPDIVAARLATKPGDLPWKTYFTTHSAEYFGVSKGGSRILIVAHGIGPMSTLDGVQEAYSWEYKGREHNHRGGRITRQEFWDLEAGKFGDVSVVDVESYVRGFRYPFMEVLRASQAMTDKVLKARLGSQTEDYVRVHADAARQWHLEQSGTAESDPYILKVEDPDNCGYHIVGKFHSIEPGYALAHLVSTGGLCKMHHDDHRSLVLDVGCHEWGNGVRLIGIKAGADIRSGLREGPDADKLLRKHWRELLIPVRSRQDIGFYALVKIGNQWFTQYPKTGERMDTWEPEFVVTSARKVGKPALFRTSAGAGFFFKFGVKEVKTLAPPNANAYFFCGEPRREGHDHHVCEVQFYRIEADTSKRLVRADKLAHDYDTMMGLMASEAIAA